MTKIADKIIVALDVPTKSAALALTAQLSPEMSFFKVGLQLYTAEGPALVREIAATGAKVFLDLKLHDIPSTVARAVESAAQLGVQMLTVHLSGGAEMIRAALTASKGNLLLLGVTVLTSATAETLRETGVAESIEEQVVRLAKLGTAAGIKGLVASPHEVKPLREVVGAGVKIVTPGIRPAWAQAGDQKRVMTPREALEAGADYVVIGRPITAHANPRDAARRILDELAS